MNPDEITALIDGTYARWLTFAKMAVVYIISICVIFAITRP